MKVLMALLDEEASTPLCQNKADLLSEDQPVLSGAEGTCVLALFRSEQMFLLVPVWRCCSATPSIKVDCRETWFMLAPRSGYPVLICPTL